MEERFLDMKGFEGKRYGKKVICRIIKDHQSGFRVQISKNIFGEVDITNLSDEFKPNPKESFSLLSCYPGRIISKENQKTQISLRISL